MTKTLLTIACIFLGAAVNATSNNCESSHGDIVKVNITPRGIVLDLNGDIFKGKIDESYNPRSHTNFSRYTGDFSGLGEGQIWILAENSLVSGEKFGTLKIQSRGEGFETESYMCTRKAD